MSADQFQRYFSRQSSITDARLIPHRRIGYVGYKSPQDAIKAVKYHNKSFINMSRIQVELARSVEQEDVLKSHGRTQFKVDGRTVSHLKQAEQQRPTPLKRKRNDEQNSNKDSRLEEYLEVMQPTSKTRTWANGNIIECESGVQDSLVGEKNKDGTIHQASEGVDADYEEVPKENKKKASQDTKRALPAPVEVAQAEAIPENAEPSSAPGDGPRMGHEFHTATDDEWLRSRTSRLLGLIDEDDESSARKETLDADKTPKDEVPRTLEDGSSSASSKGSVQLNGEDTQQARSDALPVSDQIQDSAEATGRLFVRNLPYTTVEDDLRQHFEQVAHGHIEEVHLPVSYQSENNKGFAYIQYSDPESAVRALRDLDGKPFQGRLLHVMPSAARRQSGLDEIAISKLPLRKQQQIKRRAAAASSTFNWNSMYMNADAVMSSISDRLGVHKSDLLDPTSADAAVKQAHAETHIIQETKSYFLSHGVNLDAFKRKQRGDNTILVKNFSYGTKPEELQKLFETYGTIRRLLMPPSGTIAIVDFVQVDHARSAFSSLAYRKFKDSVLFLEKAPKDLFSVDGLSQAGDDLGKDRVRDAKQSATDLLEDTTSQQVVDTATLFVRNLNFSTTSERLRDTFKPLDGFLSARVKTKPDPKHAGQLLSMGFGFLEFRTKTQAQAALAAMHGHNLDDHELLIKASHKGADAAEERRREDNAKKIAGRKTKIIIKNLPFQASKKDVRSLFGSYGQLRSVRVPKKFDSSTRGFAFADFVTAREAENAIDALKDTHLLGRRLALDFAAEDEVDPEKEIAKMQQKAGRQANKVALQRLTGSGRKKFIVEGNEDIDRG
ncbi:MAG: hypothetical protein Q9181_002976 [Wetmoreana brouardii]